VKAVRWGLIGCGQIAVDRVLPAMRAAAGVDLVAVADPLRHRRDLAEVESYPDHASLLADPRVEAIYVAVPTGLHLDVVLDAADAGKDILCEKPLGRNSAEVVQMADRADACGVRLMTAYMSRFGDVFQAAAAAVRDGAIGEVTFAYANFSYPALGPYPPGSAGGWRWTDPVGGGPLLDIGVYLAFGLREILGQRIDAAGARAARTVAPAGSAVPDTTMAWFVTENGIPGVLAATFSHTECRITLHGTGGRLDLTDCFAQVPTGRLDLSVGGRTTTVLPPPGLPDFDNYRREIEHFSQAIRSGAPHRPDTAAVLADTELLDALKGSQA
jgi:predicted dehydrogenase